MKFSVVLITRNEEKTLPRLLASLQTFKNRGGEICVCDTGSTDNTVKIARDFGCKVEEVGGMYSHVIDQELADKINKHFLVDDEQDIVKAGEKYFDFASARNHSTQMSSNDWVCTVDADEELTTFDIDAIEKALDNPRLAHVEYDFVFSHDQFGNPAVNFIQSKFFDRKKIEWRGIVHEVITPINGGGERMLLPKEIFRLEHWQQPGDRHSYLRGLAVDCYLHPESDRNSHYFARELLWSKRPKTAIKEFTRHIGMGGWVQERSQSMVFIAECYGALNQPEKQAEWYSKAFYIDSSRRGPLIKLAQFYLHNKNYQAAVAYAKAALEIPWSSFYANDREQYENLPHEVLYRAYGWLGRISEAQYHITKALEYRPQHPEYLRDRYFYFGSEYEYKDSGIEGWMSIEDLNCLYKLAKDMDSVLELGSWKGRSTHALASACKGTVTCVDTWAGSVDPRDDTNWMAKREDIFATFKRNTKDLKNVVAVRKTGMEASKDYPDKSFDMVFIDAGHTYEEVKEDIAAWLPKARKIIAGDDYLPETWMGVCKAVDEAFGKPDKVVGKIWYIDLSKKKDQKELNELTEKVKKGEDFSFVKLGDGEMIAMIGNGENNGGKNIDGSTYSPELGEVLVRSYKSLIRNGAYIGNMFQDIVNRINDGFVDGAHDILLKDYVNFLLPKIPELEIYDRNVPGNILLHQTGNLTPELYNFYFAVRESDRRKIFIGPKKLSEVATLLRAEFIEVPEVDAILSAKDVLSNDFEDTIVLVSAGMAAKAFIGKINATYKCTTIDLGSAFDPLIGQTRTGQASMEEVRGFYHGWISKIPKRIFTVWLGDEPSDMIKKCIESQKIPGYEHQVIGAEVAELFAKDHEYLRQALDAKKWVKAADYLKALLLYTYGGIYLDADMEVLPGKNFDDMLNSSLFSCREENGFIGYSVVGSVAGHQIFRDYLKEVPLRFRGDDNLNFESSMEIFTRLIYAAGEGSLGINLYQPDFFFPYNHQTGLINVTPNTRAFHHFAKSWINTSDLLPRVSILIPTLGRPDGLKRCLESIDKLYYPKHLIETIVLDGDGTVPEKMAKMLEQAKGDYICYAANDMEFEPNTLYTAIKADKTNGLVAFHEGPVSADDGNICTHFIIHKDLIPLLNKGQIFDTDFRHTGVDNYLWAQATKFGRAIHCDAARINHYHFSRGYENDEIYKKGWEHVRADRELLKVKLAELEK